MILGVTASTAFTLILLVMVETVLLKACYFLLQMVCASVNNREILGAWMLTLILALAVVMTHSVANILWGFIT